MRKILLNTFMILSLAMPVLVPSVALAAASDNACPGANTNGGQVLQGVGESGNNCDSSGVGNLISDIVSLLSYFVGVLAVIMIIVAGTKYITSGGDSNKIGNAKSTLLYAMIGLAVAALAQVLVRFVLFHATQAASGG